MFAHEIAERILGQTSRALDLEARIVVQSQGSVGSTPSVAVSSVQAGFDWDSGKLLIYPEQALTTLTPDDVAAIHDSVRKGGSWHAYQQYKKQAERIKALEAWQDDVRSNSPLLARMERAERRVQELETELAAERAAQT